jgi:hypothetical protein
MQQETQISIIIAREPSTEPRMIPVGGRGVAAAVVGPALVVGAGVEVVYSGTHSVNVAVVVKLSETDVVSISQNVLLGCGREEAMVKRQASNSGTITYNTKQRINYNIDSYPLLSDEDLIYCLPPSLLFAS